MRSFFKKVTYRLNVTNPAGEGVSGALEQGWMGSLGGQGPHEKGGGGLDSPEHLETEGGLGGFSEQKKLETGQSCWKIPHFYLKIITELLIFCGF